MGSSSIYAVLPKVTHPTLKRDLQQQLDVYSSVKERLREQMRDYGGPSHFPIMDRAISDVGVTLSSMSCVGPQEAAEFVLKGTQMGIRELEQVLRRNVSADFVLKAQGEALKKQEQGYVEKLKFYL